MEVYISFLRKKLTYLCSQMRIACIRNVGYAWRNRYVSEAKMEAGPLQHGALEPCVYCYFAVTAVLMIAANEQQTQMTLNAALHMRDDGGHQPPPVMGAIRVILDEQQEVATFSAPRAYRPS